jgi:predicted double-glycine peptidase
VKWLLAVAAAGILLAPGISAAQTPVVAGGTLFNVPVKSLVDMRFESVVRQKYDLSCGAAAMATIFQYYYHSEIGEKAIIDGIFEFGDEEKISRDGFSMLELKQFAENEGFVVQVYRLSDVNVLADLNLPFIALISVGTYQHFVVVRGIDNDTVFIADPAFGNLHLDVDTFARAWKWKAALFLVDSALYSEIARTQAIPDHVKEQTLAFVDAGRVLSARPQEVQTLIDYGFRPMQPDFGSFR